MGRLMGPREARRPSSSDAGKGRYLELTFCGRPAPAWAVVSAKLASLALLLALLNSVTADLAERASVRGLAPALLFPATEGTVQAANASAVSALVGHSSEPDTAPTTNKDGKKRWLWWPFIVYVFWAMAHVCDHYFVRTIDVISERFNIPDDVAGATLMALGCNGPELALNTISIFHPSDIGVGAVVGGEVFNVLVIIGTAVLATPSSYMPLKLGLFTFSRDVIYYAISVALLYWVLKDGVVTPREALTLLVGALCYILTVVFSDALGAALNRAHRLKRSFTRTMTQSLAGLIPKLSVNRGLNTDGTAADESDFDSDSSEEDPEMVELWSAGVKCIDPFKGSVLAVRVDLRNRMMDRTHHYDDRYMCLGEDSMLLSTATRPKKLGFRMDHRSTNNMVYDREGPRHQNWHHAGLVNAPVYLETSTGGKMPTPQQPLSQPLVASGDNLEFQAEWLQNPHFQGQAVEIIPLEDILYVERTRDTKHLNLHVQHHNSDVGNTFGGVITLEFRAKEDIIEAWASALMVKLIEVRRRTAGPPPAKTFLCLVKEWVDWFQFPVKFWLSVTVPDMDKPHLQHLYPISFVMSMVWLAIFAFSVIGACDGIHKDFGISTKVLGFTVAAAGTSFPNVFSGMVVAQQGKTTMAVANALGANVQNVFLALAIPWTVQSCFIDQGPFSLPVSDLGIAIVDCYLTLFVVLVVFVSCSYSMPTWSGGFFLFTYAVYLVFALGQDFSSCYKWPLQC